MEELEFLGLAFYINVCAQVDLQEEPMFLHPSNMYSFSSFLSVSIKQQLGSGELWHQLGSAQSSYHCYPKRYILALPTAGVRKWWHSYLPSFWFSHHSVFLVLIYFKEDACSVVSFGSPYVYFGNCGFFPSSSFTKNDICFWMIFRQRMRNTDSPSYVPSRSSNSASFKWGNFGHSKEKKRYGYISDIYTICMLVYI